jgi:hypothetical protein
MSGDRSRPRGPRYRALEARARLGALGASIPLYRFHLITGCRLALRAWTPLIGAATIGVGLQPDPAATLAGIAGALAGPAWDRAAWILVAILLVASAVWAAPRVTAGSRGWIRHLPASRGSRLVALWLALSASLLPPVAALLALAALQAWISGGAAWWALPGAVLVAVRPLRRIEPPGARAPAAPRLPLDLRIARRALGPRLVSAWVAGLLPLSGAWLFTHNNALPLALERRGVVLGAGLAITTALGFLAEELAARRPVWPWARALPIGSRRRTLTDALFLGGLVLPIAALAAAIDPLAAIVAGAAIPLLALRAAAAMRRGGDERTAALAPVLAEGSAVAAALTLFPIAAFLALAAVPFALRAAAREDRSLRVSRWSERHHQAAGDPLSWTA